MTNDEAWGVIPMCGCGALEEWLETLHWILWAHTPVSRAIPDAMWIAQRLAFYGYLEERSGGMFWGVLYMLEQLDLTEHGGSVRAGWLTEKGEDARRWLDAHGCDPDAWPEDP